jgi:cytochrome P450
MSSPRQVPHFPGAPLLGHYVQFRRNLLPVLLAAMQRCGEAARIPVAYENVYLFNSPEAVQRILIEVYPLYARGRSHHALRRMLGDGMLTVDGESWIDHRRAARESFRPARCAQMAGDIAALTDRMLDRWEPLAAQERPLILMNELMQLTAQISCTTLLGYTMSDEEAAQFVADFLLAQTHGFKRMTNPLQPPSPRAGLALRRIRALADRIRAAAPDSPLAPQVMTILATAPENPSNTLAWTLFLLATRPQVEARIRREARAGADLAYTKMVVSETMRLYPGAWGYERTAIEDDVVAGYHLPAGSLVVLSPFTMHRNSRYWTDAQSFVPERFLPERIARQPRFSYFPFSGGPRRCIGDSFTLAIVHAVLPRIVERFHVRLAAEERGEMLPLFTLRPRTGIRATVQRVSSAMSGAHPGVSRPSGDGLAAAGCPMHSA